MLVFFRKLHFPAVTQPILIFFVILTVYIFLDNNEENDMMWYDKFKNFFGELCRFFSNFSNDYVLELEILS